MRAVRGTSTMGIVGNDELSRRCGSEVTIVKRMDIKLMCWGVIVAWSGWKINSFKKRVYRA
jgi:hypothetical protein